MTTKRDDALTFIANHPGAHIQLIANALGITHPTAAYHLRKLLNHGHLITHQDGNRTCFFLTHSGIPEETRRTMTATNHNHAKRILEAIQRGPTYRKKLSQELNVPRTTLNWHVDRLIHSGLVRETRQGRIRMLHASMQSGNPINTNRVL